MSSACLPPATRWKPYSLPLKTLLAATTTWQFPAVAPVCLVLALLPLLKKRPHQKRNLLPSPSSPISRINQTTDLLSTSSPPRLVSHKQPNNPEYHSYSHRLQSTSLSSSLGAQPPVTQRPLVSARPPNSFPAHKQSQTSVLIIVSSTRLVFLRPF